MTKIYKMYFSTQKGTPIAIAKPNKNLRGKKSKSFILYVSDKPDSELLKNRDLISEKDISPHVHTEVYEEVMEAIKSGKPPTSKDAKEYYKVAQKAMKEKMGKSINMPNYYFSPIPRDDGQRDCCFVAGPSGSGKTTWVATYAYNYSKLNPDNLIYLFSRLESDENIDCVPNLHRIHLTPEQIEGYEVRADELENSLVIFDDYDTIPNKKVKAFVASLIDDLLQTGRHANTSVVITSHLTYNSAQTRIILNEIFHITLFPSRSTEHSLNYLLGKYFGFSKKEVNDLRRTGSRWVTIYKNPTITIHEKGAIFR